MKWDQIMNVAVVRSHFKALIENPDTYSKRLHKNFKETYPDLDVTAQTVLDQKRTIFNKACMNTSGTGRAKKLLGAWISQAWLDAINAEDDILYTGRNGHQNNQPSFNRNPDVDEIIRSDTAEHFEDNMVDQNTGESENTTPINDPLTEEEKALHDRLKIKFEKAVLIEFGQRRRFKRPTKRSLNMIKQSIKYVNYVLEQSPITTENISELNRLIYASTLIAIEDAQLVKQCIITPKQPKHVGRQKIWENKLSIQIDKLHSDISKIFQTNTSTSSIKIKRNTAEMRNKYKITSEVKRISTLESLKQRLSATSYRLKQFKKRQLHYNHNYTFENNPQKSYRELREERVEITNPPTEKEIENFWRPIYENDKSHNDNAQWINDHIKYIDTLNLDEQQLPIWESKDVSEVIKKMSHWKGAGVDNLQIYWRKHFSFTHNRLSTYFSEILHNLETSLEWFTFARTTLAPKTNQATHPSKYLPISCLPTVYKIFSSTIAKAMKEHIDINNLIPEEQKGCASNSLGCIDQLLIDKIVMCDAKNNQKNLSIAWIDYAKAYDSILHTWIVKCSRMYK